MVSWFARMLAGALLLTLIGGSAAFADTGLQDCHDHWSALREASDKAARDKKTEAEKKETRLTRDYAARAQRAIAAELVRRTGRVPADQTPLYLRQSVKYWGSVEREIPAGCRSVPGVGRFSDIPSVRAIRSDIEEAIGDKDPGLASALATSLAEGGDAAAQVSLGRIYRDGGPGKAPDLEKAAFWFARAADQNEPGGLYELGLLYVSGKGQPADPAKGVGLIARAAEAGLPDAQAALSAAYRRGIGVGQDPALSVRWLVRAAEGGEPAALSELAARHVTGDGVARDLRLAAMWIDIALSEVRRVSWGSDLRLAIQARQAEINAMLTPEALAEAMDSARACRQRYLVGCDNP